MTQKFHKKTKIIATIGPSTWDEDKIIQLYQAGVNVLRFNFSHADYDTVSRVVKIVKNLNHHNKTKLGLMLDTKGPEIRTGDYEGIKSYHKGDIFRIWINKTRIDGHSQDQFCDYPYLLEDITIGSVIRIESGLFDVIVQEIGSDYVIVQAQHDISIKQRRHINLPGVILKLPGLMPQDKIDVQFAIDHRFDYIAMSFVRNKNNIQELRELLHKKNAPHIHIISKIENQEAINNHEEIIECSDGVMVARGDLGVEVPFPMLPIYQQKIINCARSLGTYVIVATHLLESMIENPFPTRAEVNDIYNAISQKTDAIMLSGETTIGKHPIQCVEIMKDIALQAESYLSYTIENELSHPSFTQSDKEKQQLIKSAIYIGESLGINKLLIFTKTGKLAKIAAAYQSSLTVFAFTNTLTTLTNTNLLFGIKSRYLEYDHHSNALDNALQRLIQHNDLTQGEKIIVITDTYRNNKECPTLQIISSDDYFNL